MHKFLKIILKSKLETQNGLLIRISITYISLNKSKNNYLKILNLIILFKNSTIIKYIYLNRQFLKKNRK